MLPRHEQRPGLDHDVLVLAPHPFLVAVRPELCRVQADGHAAPAARAVHGIHVVAVAAITVFQQCPHCLGIQMHEPGLMIDRGLIEAVGATAEDQAEALHKAGIEWRDRRAGCTGPAGICRNGRPALHAYTTGSRPMAWPRRISSSMAASPSGPRSFEKLLT